MGFSKSEKNLHFKNCVHLKTSINTFWLLESHTGAHTSYCLKTLFMDSYLTVIK